jgi:hypothetical protein
MGADAAPVVVLGVDQGEVEAFGMKDLGQLRHWRDVPLRLE